MESSTVTNCFPCGLDVLVGASERGQDQGADAGDGVRAVELGRDVDGEACPAHGRLGDGGVGGGADEVAAHGEEDLGVAVAQRLDGPYDVVAVVPGRGDAEFPVEGVEEGGGGAFEDAHGAVALDVGVAAHGANSRRQACRCCRAAGGS